MVRTPPKKKKAQSPSKRSPRIESQNIPRIEAENNNQNIFNSATSIAMAKTKKRSPSKGKRGKSKAAKPPPINEETTSQVNAELDSEPIQEHAAVPVETEELSDMIEGNNESVASKEKETNGTQEVSKDKTAVALEESDFVQEPPEETIGSSTDNKDDTTAAPEEKIHLQESSEVKEASHTSEEQGVKDAAAIPEEKADTEIPIDNKDDTTPSSEGKIDLQDTSQVNEASSISEEQGVKDAAALPEEKGSEVDDDDSQDDSESVPDSTVDQDKDSSAVSSNVDELQLENPSVDDFKSLSYLSSRYSVALPSNDLVVKILNDVNVLPILGDNRALWNLGNFASSCLCYSLLPYHQIFEPAVMTNAFHFTVEEFVGINALMCDNEILGCLKGVGVPEDIKEKFDLFQEHFGKCVIVGKSSEVDGDMLECHVTFDNEVLQEFDTSEAIEVANIIAGYRYKLNTIATELSEEKGEVQWKVNAFNTKADNRTNLFFHQLIHKLLLVIFLRYPQVSLAAIQWVKDRLTDPLMVDTETLLFRQNSANKIYSSLLRGCYLSMSNLKYHIDKLSQEMEEYESILCSYIDSDEVTRFLLHGPRPKFLPYLKFRWNHGDSSAQVAGILSHWINFVRLDDQSYKLGQEQVRDGE